MISNTRFATLSLCESVLFLDQFGSSSTDVDVDTRFVACTGIAVADTGCIVVAVAPAVPVPSAEVDLEVERTTKESADAGKLSRLYCERLLGEGAMTMLGGLMPINRLVIGFGGLLLDCRALCARASFSCCSSDANGPVIYL